MTPKLIYESPCELRVKGEIGNSEGKVENIAG